jgi:hypothetical protein
VPSPGHVPVSTARVMDGVDAGGAGFLVGEVGSDLSEAGEYLRGREIKGGEGAGGGAELAQALKRDHGHLGARLIGATAAARYSIGLTPWPTVIEAERRTIEQTEALLPSGEFAAQTASGRSQTIEDALTQAMLPPGGGPPGAR